MNTSLVAWFAVGMVVAFVSTPASGGLSIYPYGEQLLNVSQTNTTATTPSSLSPETTTLSKSEEDDCQEQIGTYQNGVPVNTMPKYDVEEILSEHGGGPGKLNVTLDKDVPELAVDEPKENPLPDTDNTTFWVYDYRMTDFRTYIRTEHGLLRNKGSADEYVDVRGTLYWTPPHFCNKVRHASYRVDPHSGFVADVSLEYCSFNDDKTLWCAAPAVCKSNETFFSCVAAPSSALIASLVG